MLHTLLGAARIFAGNYQFVICQDPEQIIDDGGDWTHERSDLGFSGVPTFRVVGTEADLNDHWVELVYSLRPPNFEEWQRITCVDFYTDDGTVCVMSLFDNRPPISAKIEPGEYSAYVAGQNLGVDQLSLGEQTDGETREMSDDEFAARKDLEWYRVHLVPGRPARCGRLVDRDEPVAHSTR